MTQRGGRAPDVCISVVLTSGSPRMRSNRFHLSRFLTTSGTSPPYEYESDFLATHDCETLPPGGVRARDANA
jgi:hypothetical protein